MIDSVTTNRANASGQMPTRAQVTEQVDAVLAKLRQQFLAHAASCPNWYGEVALELSVKFGQIEESHLRTVQSHRPPKANSYK